MTVDFQTWMRAVWTSITGAIRQWRARVLAMDITAQMRCGSRLALVAVLNVILVAAVAADLACAAAYAGTGRSCAVAVRLSLHHRRLVVFDVHGTFLQRAA